MRFERMGSCATTTELVELLKTLDLKNRYMTYEYGIDQILMVHSLLLMEHKELLRSQLPANIFRALKIFNA